MFFESYQQKSLQNDKRINELTIRFEKLERDLEQLFQKLGVTASELSGYLSERENFSDEEWCYIAERERELEKELLRNIENIRDPRKTKRSYETRVVQPNWLYVK